jgi:hypothetical protein
MGAKSLMKSTTFNTSKQRDMFLGMLKEASAAFKDKGARGAYLSM